MRAEKKLNDLRLEAIKISAEVLGENEEELIKKLFTVMPEYNKPLQCMACKSDAKYIYGIKGEEAGYIYLCKAHKEANEKKISHADYGLIKEI